MVQGALATASTDRRPWHHLRDVGFISMRNVRVMESRAFHLNAWKPRQRSPEKAVHEAGGMRVKVQWIPQEIRDAKNEKQLFKKTTA